MRRRPKEKPRINYTLQLPAPELRVGLGTKKPPHIEVVSLLNWSLMSSDIS